MLMSFLSKTAYLKQFSEKGLYSEFQAAITHKVSTQLLIKLVPNVLFG